MVFFTFKISNCPIIPIMYQSSKFFTIMILELNFGYKLLKLNINLQLSTKQPDYTEKCLSRPYFWYESKRG